MILICVNQNLVQHPKIQINFVLLLSVFSDRIFVPFLSVTFCLQRQKVTKERRRRCILAKNLISPLNSRGWLPTHKPTPPSREFLTLHSKKFLTLICKVATLSLREEYFFFVSPNENIGQHDSPTEPRGVKKINGENVKKALVPWYATGCLTIAWHFNAFSERH